MEEIHEISRIRTLNAAKKFLLVAIVFVSLVSSVRAADAANLYFSPSSGTYQTGRNFTVNVNVQSSTALNAASGVITFPTDKLEAIGVSKTASVFNFWVQEPSFSNASGNGNIHFEGIVLNPGFTGDGKLISVTFRVKSAGVADLAFSSGSVLANDGLGTNILSGLGQATFTLSKSAISAPEIAVTPNSLPPKPLVKHYIKDAAGELVFSHDSSSEKWVNNRYNKLAWELPKEVSGVATILTDWPTSNPGSKSDGLFDNKVFEDLAEGVNYFHIRFINAAGAGPILHYKIMVDTAPPRPFEIILPDGNVLLNPTPRIKFETTDALSGIDRYIMKIGNGDEFDASRLQLASYILPKQAPGEHPIVIRAYDKAGNFQEAKTILVIIPIVAPLITGYPTNIISPSEKLVLQGTGLPKATIEVHLNKRGQTPIVFNARADESGNWQAVYENIIPSGTYEIWAKQILENGAESLHSNSVYIGVNSWFWRAWQWIKNIGGAIAISLVILAIFAVAAYYFWYRFRMFQIKLRREINEAESAVSSGFKKLKKEIKGGVKTRKIIADLAEIEKKIEKEIEDIEHKR